MCYAYIKHPAAAREGSTDKQVTIDRDAGTPAAQPIGGVNQAEEKAVSRFFDKIHRLLATKAKREEPSSV